MRSHFIKILFLIALTGFSCQKEKPVDINLEKVAIIKVVEGETNSFFNKDFQSIINSHVNDSLNIRIGSGKDGYLYVAGWDSIQVLLKNEMDNGFDNISNIKIRNTDYLIKVYEKTAYAVYYQTMEYDYEGEHYEGSSDLQTRFLEKTDEGWKIVYLSFVQTSSYKEKDATQE